MSSGTTVGFFFDCSIQWTKLAFHNIRAMSRDLSKVFALWCSPSGQRRVLCLHFYRQHLNLRARGVSVVRNSYDPAAKKEI